MELRPKVVVRTIWE